MSKKILANNWSPLILIILLSSLIIWPIFMPGYFTHHDDLQVIRIFEMRKCLEDFQIPCRWVPDMGWGYGFPLFNYYGVLPYYIGAVMSFLVGFIVAAKILFLIPLILGGVSMYFLGKELFGRNGGLVSGILYLFAPYRSLDTYVRGAVAESFALAIVPLVFLFFLKLIRNPSRNNFLLSSLSLGLFLINHNIMTLFFMPFLIIWIVYWVLTEKFKAFLQLIFSFVLGIGLAAFFIFPAFIEKDLVRTDTLTSFDLNFRVHFATISQILLDRSWGYGASVLGPSDTISFQVGWPHLGLVLLTIILTIVMTSGVVKSRFFNKYERVGLVAILTIVFLTSIFMMHNKSAFIWESIKILHFSQFPWRFLSIAIFTSSLLGGIFILLFKINIQKWLMLVIITTTVLLNWNYFKPDKFLQINDQDKLSGDLWEQQRMGAIFDYLPKTAIEPREAAPKQPVVIQGEAEVYDYLLKSNRWSFNINVKSPSVIEVPVFDFPHWIVKLNGQKLIHASDNYVGRIEVELPIGSHQVSGVFSNTLVRSISNLISFISVVLLVLIYLYHGKITKSA
jgi:hypothetical protein